MFFVKDSGPGVPPKYEEAIFDKFMQLDKKAAQKMRQKIADAKEILDAVESDGSWGVHNPRYTARLLDEARRKLTPPAPGAPTRPGGTK